MRSPTDQHKFLRSAGAVSAAVGLSRITGLVREMVMAHLFGAGAAYDAFLLGFRIPNLTRNLFAEGALSSAFVPTFAQTLATKGKEEAERLSNLVGAAIIFGVGALCALGMIFSPQLVRLLGPGFAEIPGKTELATLLTRVMFPFLVLVALSAQAMGVLNALGRFGVPATASTFFNIGSVAVGVGLGFTVGRQSGEGLIVSMAFGVLAGGLFQLLWQVPFLLREGIRFHPRFDFGHPGFRQIARLMVPAIIGNAAFQINVVVNTNLASNITDAAGHVINGPVSWLGYAFRFMQLPLGLFGVSLASATLPDISRSAALNRIDEFRDSLAHSLGVALLLTVPASVGLAALGESMIGAVYQQGRFRLYDTHQTAVALACYSVGLAGYAALKILAPAFYALNDARTPMLVSVASIAVNLAAALALLKWARMGHAGLALSTSIAALLGSAALFALLRKRIGGLHGARLAASAAKTLAAAAVMGAACVASSHAIHAGAGYGKLAQLADLTISIPLGAAVFFALARALGIEELEAVRDAIFKRDRPANA